MRGKILILFLLLVCISQPVYATQYQAPEPPGMAQRYMPEDTETFSEGLWHILQNAIYLLHPQLAEAATVSLTLFAIVLLTALVSKGTIRSTGPAELAAVCMISLTLLRSVNSMISLGVSTVTEITQYSKLLLPVLTAALAASGNISTATALCTGATVFITALTSIIGNILVPLVYVYIAVSVGACALRGELLSKITAFCKWLITWILRISIYVFTGYISITGAVSGTADASVVKATKLTISGVVPVVGKVIADASEAIVAGAAIMKSSAGVYGILATVAILIGPFLTIGLQYLLLKLTAALCSIFDSGSSIAVIHSFETAMGLLMGMIGTVSVMVLISTVCFMRGVG